MNFRRAFNTTREHVAYPDGLRFQPVDIRPTLPLALCTAGSTSTLPIFLAIPTTLCENGWCVRALPGEDVEMKNLITCLVVCVMSGTALADTWTVDDDGKADFDNIQAAVDAASDGDEILVMPGTYTGTGEEVVRIADKSVSLLSKDGLEQTIIDGEGKRKGIYCSNSIFYTSILRNFLFKFIYILSNTRNKS